MNLIRANIAKWGNKLEPYIFTVILLIGCWALFSDKYFFSLDGASHVYNAVIINDLLFNPDSIYEPYFKLNPFPVPNWMGHFILCVLIPLFGGIIAEKILLAIIIVGTPLAGRLLMKKLGGSVLP
ncbi:MAG: hypothetical protein ACPGEG_10000, partial [Salibacteraceae bacterium]